MGFYLNKIKAGASAIRIGLGSIVYRSFGSLASRFVTEAFACNPSDEISRNWTTASPKHMI